MTSGTILPSIGPPPPEFRRPYVPENLRPKLVSETAEQPPRQNAPARPQPKPTVRPADTQPADTLLQLAGQADQAAARAGTAGNSSGQGARGQGQNVPPPTPPPSANLGGASAVAVQVQEVRIRK